MAGIKGRHIKLTQAIQAAICKQLALAVPQKYAAEANGISERTIRHWLERGEGGEEPFVAFFAAVTRAKSQAVVRLVAKSQKDGPAGARWTLERRYRTEYGPVCGLVFTDSIRQDGRRRTRRQ